MAEMVNPSTVCRSIVILALFLFFALTLCLVADHPHRLKVGEDSSPLRYNPTQLLIDPKQIPVSVHHTNPDTHTRKTTPARMSNARTLLPLLFSFI
jgi:hypothetical protein